MQTFQRLFNLSIWHSYFKDGRCTVLRLVPDQNTKRILTDHSLVINMRDNEFEFFVRNQDDIPSFLTYLNQVTGESYLQFELQVLDEEFYNYTEGPIDRLEKKVFDSDSLNNSKDEKGVQLASQPSSSNQSLLLVRIHISSLISEYDSSRVLHYNISFKARATQWQYFIINQSRLEFSKLYIEGDDRVTFSDAETVILNNGQESDTFSSVEYVLQLSQQPIYMFNLVSESARPSNSMNSNKTTIFKGLPSATPSKLGVEQQGDETIVTSSMYIYL